MAKAKTLVGLDVHAAKVVAAILDAETGELRFGWMLRIHSPSSSVRGSGSSIRAVDRVGSPNGDGAQNCLIRVKSGRLLDRPTSETPRNPFAHLGSARYVRDGPTPNVHAVCGYGGIGGFAKLGRKRTLNPNVHGDFGRSS